MGDAVGVKLLLDPEVWRRTRAYCFLEGITASALVEGFLRELVMEGSSGTDNLDRPEDVDADPASGLRPSDHGQQDR